MASSPPQPRQTDAVVDAIVECVERLQETEGWLSFACDGSNAPHIVFKREHLESRLAQIRKALYRFEALER